MNHQSRLIGMRKMARFSCKREAHWLIVIGVVGPLLAILFSILIPGLWRLFS